MSAFNIPDVAQMHEDLLHTAVGGNVKAFQKMEGNSAFNINYAVNMDLLS